MSMMSEFKDFAMKGNVLDMAAGHHRGSVRGKIVPPVVSDILMPPIGLLLGKVDFSSLFIPLSEEAQGKSLAAAKAAGAATINYGVFLQTVLDFVILALVIFMVVKQVNRLKNSPQRGQPPAPSKEETFLTEIRDILKRAAPVIDSRRTKRTRTDDGDRVICVLLGMGLIGMCHRLRPKRFGKPGTQ